MIATVAFVLGFVVVGLTVLLVALRGGPRGGRGTLHTQTPRGRVVSAGVIAAIAVLFGVGIPIVIGVGNGSAACRRSAASRRCSTSAHQERASACDMRSTTLFPGLRG